MSLELTRFDWSFDDIEIDFMKRERTPTEAIQLGIQLHLNGLSLAKPVSILKAFGLDRSRTAVHNWAHKAGVYVDTWLRNPPAYPVGLPYLKYINFPIVAIGGVILGIELSKVSPRLRHRLAVAILQLVAVALIMTPALVYRRLVRPRYFTLEIIILHYWFPLVVATVFVVVQHGSGIFREWKQSTA